MRNHSSTASLRENSLVFENRRRCVSDSYWGREQYVIYCDFACVIYDDLYDSSNWRKYLYVSTCNYLIKLHKMFISYHCRSDNMFKAFFIVVQVTGNEIQLSQIELVCRSKSYTIVIKMYSPLKIQYICQYTFQLFDVANISNSYVIFNKKEAKGFHCWVCDLV